MKNLLPWVLVVGLLLIAGFFALGMFRSVQDVARPAIELRDQVGTQVAQLFNPTPTVLPDPVTIVREVRALARLETIQYTVEKVITAESGQGALGFLFGDRLLLVAHGFVIAGVDLGQIGPDDLALDELGRVYLHLPEAEIFVATLDNDKSYVYDRDTGLLTRGEVSLEATARRAAEAEIRQAALDDGILDQARLNAENYLYRLFLSLGFRDAFFVELEEMPESVVPAQETATPGS